MSSSIRPLFVATLLACLPAWNAHANSVGFNSPTYSPGNGQLIVTVVYDYTDFLMAGGGFDLLYDEGSLEFVSFTLGPSIPNAQWTLSGSVVAPGVVTNLGFGTKFFNGLSTAGEYGTMVFNILSTPVGDPGCDGFQLCLVATAINPLVSLAGQDVTDALLADAHASVANVPVPAALWLFGSALLGWLGLRRI